jgi:hypothetical protein
MPGHGSMSDELETKVASGPMPVSFTRERTGRECPALDPR